MVPSPVQPGAVSRSGAVVIQASSGERPVTYRPDVSPGYQMKAYFSRMSGGAALPARLPNASSRARQ
jgi:hypothetical protein